MGDIKIALVISANQIIPKKTKQPQKKWMTHEILDTVKWRQKIISYETEYG